MKVAELKPESIEKIKAYRWDNFIEKHEGPFLYGNSRRWHHFEFMQIDGYTVLLPVDVSHHLNITIERAAISKDEKLLTIFLKDTTYCESPSDEDFSGVVAIAEKIKGENFYVTVLYHERYMTNNPV
jgi:hypothetical protein